MLGVDTRPPYPPTTNASVVLTALAAAAYVDATGVLTPAAAAAATPASSAAAAPAAAASAAAPAMDTAALQQLHADLLAGRFW